MIERERKKEKIKEIEMMFKRIRYVVVYNSYYLRIDKSKLRKC